MSKSLPNTLRGLKESGYKQRPVKEELRDNVIQKLRSGEALFPGVHGYSDSVIPQIVNAILARHDFILLGLRGQAKSRILRDLSLLLDEQIPIIGGSEVNDDPLNPLSKFGRMKIQEHGDATPVDWIARDSRYVEKLATPDVTIADMIGDVDPIKAARGGHALGDELTIHYGLLPRANRGILAINELPDLAGKIQVGLFNILQEGDVQVKGYPIRLSLDVLMVFTANPEDYTARGKIITPLKDRIGAEIRTHYPQDLDIGIQITRQEAWISRNDLSVEVPDFLQEVVERIAFLGRHDKRIDQRSGVSQRMPITVIETVISNAERRALEDGEDVAVPRVSDLYAAMPAITGKMELEYEGELHGADRIARELIQQACSQAFDVRAAGADVDGIIEYFETGGALQVGADSSGNACVLGFSTVPGLLQLVSDVGLASDTANDGQRAAACELVLEALVAQRRISRTTAGYTRAPHEGPTGGEGYQGFDTLS
ncbi:MAG TPA: magnesium chelatase [Gemmatimonadetes bacterium]|nr:magnesium chelatase [Gemmatimonadota bacterium]|tara:strand:+ start:807 stop:2264 length:1458 start_codon:yes stop_codon:yes gene_type:complete